MLVNRCPGCSKPVEEKDDVCPFCGKDFSTIPQKRLFTPTPDAAQSAAPPPAARKAAPGPAEPPPPPPQSVPPATIYEPTPYAEVPPAVMPPSTPPLVPPAILYAGAAALIGAGIWFVGRPANDPNIPVLTAHPAAQAPAPSAPSAAAREETPAPARPAPPAPKPAADRREAPGQRTADAARRASPDPEDVPIIMTTKTKPRELRVQGTVFDIVTLKPVPDVEIIFTDPATGHRAATGTDAEGRYRARLPTAEGGFDMTVSHPDYEPKYVLDGIPPFKELSRKDRLQAALDEGRTLQHKELLLSAEDKPRRDLALIPLKLPSE